MKSMNEDLENDMMFFSISFLIEFDLTFDMKLCYFINGRKRSIIQ